MPRSWPSSCRACCPLFCPGPRPPGWRVGGGTRGRAWWLPGGKGIGNGVEEAPSAQGRSTRPPGRSLRPTGPSRYRPGIVLERGRGSGRARSVCRMGTATARRRARAAAGRAAAGRARPRDTRAGARSNIPQGGRGRIGAPGVGKDGRERVGMPVSPSSLPHRLPAPTAIPPAARAPPLAMLSDRKSERRGRGARIAPAPARGRQGPFHPPTAPTHSTHSLQRSAWG